MTLALELWPTDGLSEEVRSAIVDVCVAAHDEPEFIFLFTRYIQHGGRHVIGYDDGRLVAHAVATTRFVQIDDSHMMRTAYIDAVSTHPDVQGRGYGSDVMRRLAAALDDHEIGALETDKPHFYERLGWRLWRGPLAGRDLDGTVEPTPDQTGVMVLELPMSPALDLDASLTILRQPERIW